MSTSKTHVDKALVELVRISNITGKDASLVQGGGGNTSVKTEDGKYMYIKASGTALKNMTLKRGWRKLRLDMVLEILRDRRIARMETQRRETEIVRRLQLACVDKGRTKGRPSVEAHLHALLGRYVIHLHPLAVGAYVNAKPGESAIKKLFGDYRPPVLWVPYASPGFMLARKISGAIEYYRRRFGRKPEIVFLQKHGLLVSADKCETALRLVRNVIARCGGDLKPLKPSEKIVIKPELISQARRCIRQAYLEATGGRPQIEYFYADAFGAFWQQDEAARLLSYEALSPDELIYANGPAMWVGKCDHRRIARRLRRQIESGQKPSIAFLVKGVGLFVAASKKVAPLVRDIVAGSLFIRTNAHRLGGICSLKKHEREFISRWESETHRQKLAGKCV